MQSFVIYVLGLFSISELNRKDFGKQTNMKIYMKKKCGVVKSETVWLNTALANPEFLAYPAFSLTKGPTWRFINQRQLITAFFPDATDIIFLSLVRVCLVLFIALHLL